MKTQITILIFFICFILNAQVALTPQIGTSTGQGHHFIGAEIQGSNLSASLQWRPIFGIPQSDGLALFTTLYLWPYRNTPFFKMGIVTLGKKYICEVTNRAVRTMPITIGYRWYPSQKYNWIMENLSFDAGAGILLQEKKESVYFEASMNFSLFKL